MGENKLKKIIKFLRSFALPVHVCYNEKGFAVQMFQREQDSRAFLVLMRGV